jgi:hypothetical protein
MLIANEGKIGEFGVSKAVVLAIVLTFAILAVSVPHPTSPHNVNLTGTGM